MKRQNVRSLVLVLVMMLYILLGAAIFESLEASNEETGSSVLEGERAVLQGRFNLSEAAWEQIADHLVRYMPHRAGFQWRFAGAVYFSTTVITTIGYGHSTPKTNWGKIFCMLYALVGIPLNLVMFQSIGERLNTFNTFLLCGIRRKLSRNRKIPQINHVPVDHLKAFDDNNQLEKNVWPNEQIEVEKSETDINKVEYYIQINEPPKQTDLYKSPKRKVYINFNEERHCKPLFEEDKAFNDENAQNTVADDLQTSIICGKRDPNNLKSDPRSRGSKTTMDLKHASLNELLSSSLASTKFHLSDTHLICVTTAISSIFVAGGAYAFSRFEGWTYLDSLYYCIITLTTVGFGDLVALQNDKQLQNKPAYVALNVLFILTGLAVVSAAMNLLVLRFLTMNTEDEKRDMIKETILKSKIDNFSEDPTTNSQNNLGIKSFSCQSGLNLEDRPPLWHAMQQLFLIGRHFICQHPSPLASPPSTLRYPVPNQVRPCHQQQSSCRLHTSRYDYLLSEKYPNHSELPFPVNLYHSRSRLLTL